MRQYRRSLLVNGQVSPLHITDLVQPHLIGRSFADVGCGAGVPVSILRARWPWTPAFMTEEVEKPYFVGVDFSPRAVTYARQYGAYDRVILAVSAAIPLDDEEVDVSMSLENLEHLYAHEVIPALEELVRLARRRVVFTTPWPWDVVNVPWLTQEIAAARTDPDPLGLDEFRVLAGCVHKSTLLPEQLARCGFTCASVSERGIPLQHPVYVGEKEQIDLSMIGSVIGLDDMGVPDEAGEFKTAYLQLLEASLDLRTRTPALERSRRFGRARQRRISGR